MIRFDAIIERHAQLCEHDRDQATCARASHEVEDISGLDVVTKSVGNNGPDLFIYFLQQLSEYQKRRKSTDPATICRTLSYSALNSSEMKILPRVKTLQR